MKRWSALLAGLLLFSLSGGGLAEEHVVYYHKDALGSPVAATNDSGEVLWSESYEPYGSRVVNPADPNRLWYTGKPEESELGLTYFGARWYEPGIGRFHGIDPKDVEPGDVYSFNRYAYANDNPYKFVDPDGQLAVPAIVGVVVGAGILLSHSDYANAPGQSDAPSSLSVVDHLSAIAAAAALPSAGLRGSFEVRAAPKLLTGTSVEVVQRAMSRAELEAIQKSGTLSRGGRPGPHHVSDSVNSGGNRARQRLALPQTPEVRATLEVPRGAFSSPSKVKPDFGMPGGGLERTAPGTLDIPARTIRADSL